MPVSLRVRLVQETQHGASVLRLWWISALVVFEAVEASQLLFDCRIDLSAAGSSFELSVLI
jgi:hypothetical protein